MFPQKIRSQKIVLFQLILTIPITFGIGFLSTLPDQGWRDFMPGKAILVVLTTVAICFLIGLPIRLNKKVNKWWTGHQVICLAGIICGSILLYLSSLKYFQEVESYYDIVMVKTNPFLSITGWFLTSFCLLHLCPARLKLVYTDQP